MKVGVPAEVKSDEYRVALTPAGALELSRRGHDVVVERDAGVGSGVADEELEIVRIPLAQVPSLIHEITDAKTLIGLLLLVRDRHL